MKAMILNQICEVKQGSAPLKLVELPVPEPSSGEILIRVAACGVCHTEIDEIEGRTAPPGLPVIPGHQIVGTVEKTGTGATKFKCGERVGVGWIYGACGTCHWCLTNRENLCESFLATGRDRHGGYAEYMKISEGFAYAIPDIFSAAQAAPLLCAGAIGYRSLRLSGIEDGQNLGLTGFGASAHLVLKMVRYRYPHINVYVFARNEQERSFAMELGALWTGDASEKSPVPLDAIIDTTPAWKPVVEAMANLARGGRLVINAIRKENVDKNWLTRIDYPVHLWLEKEIKSVANVTRLDIREFLELAARIPIIPEVQTYPLENANEALRELKGKKIRGAKVLMMPG
ncbi:MAG: zinc-dependent alcohol dehydrogenase family protein [Syntrophales bacterium]|nr:zinc-dependent alcohol dehydrogenase family protein [Syntrophales bacterium]